MENDNFHMIHGLRQRFNIFHKIRSEYHGWCTHYGIIFHGVMPPHPRCSGTCYELFSLIKRFLNKLSQAVRKTDDHFHVFPMAMVMDAFTATTMPRTIDFRAGAIIIDPILGRTVN
jgi:hypothetical protein